MRFWDSSRHLRQRPRPQRGKSPPKNHRRLRGERLEDRRMMIVGADFLPEVVSAGSEGGRYDGVVQVSVANGGFCTGTLLSTGRHVLTAAHCVDSTPDNDGDGIIEPGDGIVDDRTVTVRFHMPDGVVSYDVSANRISLPPSWDGNWINGSDLAILELLSFAPAEAKGFDIYRGADEVGQWAYVVGYGTWGNADASDYNPPDGLKRWGTNYFDGVASGGSDLVMDLDQDSADWSSLQNEVMTAPGDSGGPAFLWGPTGLEIASVHSRGAGMPSFGDTAIQTRVSAFAGWIDAATSGFVLDMNRHADGNDGVYDRIEVSLDNFRGVVSVNGKVVYTDFFNQLGDLIIVGSGDRDIITLESGFSLLKGDLTVEGGGGDDLLVVQGLHTHAQQFDLDSSNLTMTTLGPNPFAGPPIINEVGLSGFEELSLIGGRTASVMNVSGAPEDVRFLLVNGGEGDNQFRVAGQVPADTWLIGGDDDDTFVVENGASSGAFGELGELVVYGGAGDNSLQIVRGFFNDRVTVAKDWWEQRDYVFLANVDTRVYYTDVNDLRIQAGAGNDTIDVQSLAPATSLTVESDEDRDQLRVAGGVSNVRLLGGGGDDELIFDNVAVASAAAGAIQVDGGAGDNSLRIVSGSSFDTIDVRDEPGQSHYVRLKNSLLETRVDYANVNALHIQAGGGGDKVHVSSFPANTFLTIDGEDGKDEITVAGGGFFNAITVDGGEGPDTLRIVAGPGDDEVYVDYSERGNPRVLVNGELDTQVFYSGFEDLHLQAGAGRDTIHVARLPPMYLTIEGGDDDDQITFENGVDPNVLIVDGGEGADSLRIVKGSDSDDFDLAEYGNGYHHVWVRSAFETLTLYRNVEGLHLQAGAGNDTIDVASLPSITSLAVEGGEGDDYINAAAAPRGAGLDGGAGDDTLIGSAFNDLLLGGEGADRIEGRGGDDLLLGGVTAYNSDMAEALPSILAEWASDRDYLTRATNLRDPQRDFFLAAQGSAATVFDDEAADDLIGEAGQDWFFARLEGENADAIFDLAADEAVDALAPETLDFNRHGTRDTAYRLDVMSGSLQLANAELRNEQWFRFELTEPQDVTIALDFRHDEGDLDMYLYAGADASPLDESAGADDGERIAGDLPAGEYFLRVIGYNGARNIYDLSIDAGAVEDTTDGERSTHDAAHDFGALSGPVELADVELQNDHWYRFEIAEPTNVTIVLDFLHDDGDLDMYLYAGDDDTPFAESAGADDGERIFGDLPAGVYYLRVIGYHDAQNVYDLSIDVGAAATNGTRDAAHDFGALTGAVQLSGVELRSDHWYRFEVTQATSVSTALDFLHDEGDLDMYLYAGDDDSPLDKSEGADDGEAISLQLEPGVYYLRIVGYNGAQNHYDLSLAADD